MSSLLPVHTADQLRSGVTEYLTTSFSLADKPTAARLADFLTSPDSGMFHGPYVRTRLPYAPDNSGERFYNWLSDSFTPYRHQAEAFTRLSSLADSGESQRPEPTLVITGTGSGKTESFLYPILDHCRRSAGHGIKALILYPMNALAADQEQRLADLITDIPALNGVRAGIYTGESSNGGGRKVVSHRGLITDRDVIRANPPDILLTNYKMLDQLLVREEDKVLWQASGTSLQYLALDEFHTYDGAQGTDVALLLRRLGLALKSHQPADFLTTQEQQRPLGCVTPVATSATLGGDDNRASMLDFAYTIFGEQLSESAIVTETTLTYDQWVGAVEKLVGPSPVTSEQTMPDLRTVTDVNQLVANAINEGKDYQATVHAAFCEMIWQCSGDRDSAVAAYTRHPLTRAILDAAASPRPLSLTEGEGDSTTSGDGDGRTSLVEMVLPQAVQRMPDDGAAEFLTHVLSEMAFLRADYVHEHSWQGKTLPGVESHLWVREVSRVDRLASTETSDDLFRWADDGPQEDSTDMWLPACYCRVCGRSGWMVSTQPGDTALELDPTTIRGGSIMHPERQRPLLDASDQTTGLDTDTSSSVIWLDPHGGRIQLTAPSDEDLETGDFLPVLTYTGEDGDREKHAKEERCPSCGTTNAIRYLGSSVATLLSVALSNLFGQSDLDDADKKTLVFTDSVQDAAHRAGFIQSRARTFALRTRIRDAVGDGTVTLTELTRRIVDQVRDDPRGRYELIPPHMVNWKAFRGYWEPKADSTERRQASIAVERRLGLDIDLEFGQRADLPRSLASTGALTASVDISDRVLLKAATTATENINLPMGEVDLLGWARGTVELIRSGGGIHHPLFDSYLHNDCNPYLLNRRSSREKGVPAFARGGAPAFPRASGAGGKVIDSDRTASTPLGSPNGTWARWTRRAIFLDSSLEGANAATALAKELAALDVLDTTMTDSGGTIYHLNPNMVIVSAEDAPEILECPQCHAHLAAGAEARHSMLGQACRTQDCAGRYEITAIADNYYRRLYESSTPRTIVSREHTSLLDKKVRTQVEDQFKASEGTAPDAPNVLVATPTLEMGIDIGDLSTVMLASLPNTVASYIQRVGRAGRLTGNSLILALVRGRGTALPALERPLSMIAGAVDAPSAFLSAEEILHRQFSAFLLDRFRLAEFTDAPHHAQDVFVKKPTGGQSVVRVLLERISAGIDDEITAFSATLADHVADSVLNELRQWATGTGPDSLTGDLLAAETSWNSENAELRRQGHELDNRYNDLSARIHAAGADDDIRSQYNSTRAALRAVDKRRFILNQEHWISALERYGIMPNFTLLDDAVDLSLSVTFLGEDMEVDSTSYDYTRDASSALTELAPGATFYAQGVAATIDAVDLGPENSMLEQWRVCPECSHSEIVPPGEAMGTSRSCPSCGAAAWREIGQVIDVLPMKRVFAQVEQTRSAITDARDDRSQTRFHRNLSMRVPAGTDGVSWYLTGTGFGLHHLPKVELRWMNLGRGTTSAAPKNFGGRETPAPMFTVCSRCGHTVTVKYDGEENSWRDHRAWCPLRSVRDPEPIDIALGRTMTTEGVLLRLPQALTVMDGATVPSLIAAVKLGFKEVLGGNPSHLAVATVRVGSGSEGYDALLLHDTVPGGTGYLSQFTRVDQVEKLLHTAYNRVHNCVCSPLDRAACPKCLLPYAPSGQVDSISRAAADSALAKILLDNLHPESPEDAAKATWPESSITETVPEPDDRSQLEAEFLAAFQEALAGASLKKRKHGTAAEWTFQFPGSPHVWTLREQYDLGWTRPDFVLEAQDTAVRPVALYLDGAKYHASEVNNRVADDIKKRNRLAIEMRYVPWSLTWQDVQNFRDRDATVMRAERPMWFKEAIREKIDGLLGLSKDERELLYKDPMSQMLSYLETPDLQRWDKLAVIATMHAANVPNNTDSYVRDLVTVSMLPKGTSAFPQLTLASRDSTSDAEEYLEAWRLFLSLANLFYLNDAGCEISVDVGTVHQVETPELASDPVAVEDTAAAPHADFDVAWTDVLAEFPDEPEVASAFENLSRHSVEPPSEVGEEISQVPTIVSWNNAHVALVYDGDASDAPDGWTFIETTQITDGGDELPAALTSLRK